MTADGVHLANRITQTLMAWYQANQRSFAFRGTRDPYRVWLSEIMLQQTRTETVGPYYERFLRRFPDVFSLAGASQEEVLKAWEGLGYYTRARNLHKTAGLVAQNGGVFPQTAEELQKLPGIGEYAAAAIASIAYDQPVPAMDGNLNRVISRLYMITEDIGLPAIKKQLRGLGEQLMPKSGAGDMNQAMMDLGATICLPGTPDCPRCPVVGLCKAKALGEPALLPTMKAKKQPQQVPVAVTLLTCDNKVLVIKRQEALLKNLYVFLLKEGDASPQAALSTFRKLAPRQIFVEEVGAARHIFTHRVWNMRIYTANIRECVPVKDGVWADLDALRELPMPVAMNAAKAQALNMLGGTVENDKNVLK